MKSLWFTAILFVKEVNKMKRAAVYVRVSSERQAGPEKVSVEIQEADCRKLCQEKGYEVLEVICDSKRYKSKGKMVEPSGWRKDRPGWKRLLNLARDGAIEVIVSWREDRLMRGLWPAAELADLLEERKDLVIELAKETFDPKMLPIKAGVARWESDAIKQRTLAAREESLRRGRLPGGDQLLYGYRRGEGNLPEVDQPEARLVKDMFSWYAAGSTLTEIRGLCDQSGIRPRKNRRWAHATVCGILHRPELYACGVVTTTLAGEAHVLQYPPIVEADLLAQVLQRREENRRYRGGHKHGTHFHLLKGLVVCPCGWHMVARFDKRWPANARYVCQRKTHGKPVDPKCPRSYPIRQLDAWVWSEVERLILDPERLHALAEEEVERLRQSADEAEGKLEKAEKQAERLEQERAWVISNARIKLLSSQDLEHQLTEIVLQQAAVEKECEELRLQKAIAEGTLSGADAAIEAIAKEVETHFLLSSDLDQTKANAIPLSLAGNSLMTADGKPVCLSLSDLAGMLGCKADLEVMRRTQYERRCELLRRWVGGVKVYLDDDGAKQTELQLTLPLSIGLPASRIMPRGMNVGNWWRK